MLEGLQKKWKVTSWRLVLILLTFALGGSATGYVGRKLLGLVHIGSTFLYVVSYVILITLLWPLMVLVVSIPFGQFNFFVSYLKKIGRRFQRKKNHTLP